MTTAENPTAAPQPAKVDRIEHRLATHRQSIENCERAIIILTNDRDTTLRTIGAQIENLTLSYQSERSALERKADSTAARLTKEIDEHRRLRDSGLAAVRSLEGQDFLVATGDEASNLRNELAEARALLAELSAKAAPTPTPPRRKPISKATARKAVDSHIKSSRFDAAVAGANQRNKRRGGK
jgi:uncharacterized protein YlaN (UPF0358 family)